MPPLTGFPLSTLTTKENEMSYGIVALLGEKGGCGKTTLAHSISGGVRDFGGEGVYVLSDNRMLLSANEENKRWYAVVDGRTESAMREWIGRAKAVEGNGILVIDGAGGNPVVDSWLCSLADLVILPMTPDEEAVRTCAIDAARIPNAIILPNRWNTNAKAADVDKDYIAMAQHFVGADRVLPPVPQVHAVAEFVRSDFSGVLLPSARTFCRLLTGAVISLLQERGAWK